MRSTWPQLASVIRPFRLRLVILSILSLAGGLIEAASLVMVARLGIAIASESREPVWRFTFASNTYEVGVTALFTATLAAMTARLFFTAAVSWITASVTTRTIAELRRGTYSDFIRASWARQSVERDGRLQDIMTTFVRQGGTAVGLFTRAVAAGAGLAAMVATALVLNPLAVITVILLLGGLFVAMRPFATWTRRLNEQLTRQNVRYARTVAETAAMVRDLRVFKAEDAMVDRMRRIVDSWEKTARRSTFSTRFAPSAYRTAALLVLTAALGGLYLLGGTELPSLAGVVLVLVRSSAYGQQLQSVYQDAQEALPWLQTLFETRSDYRDNAQYRGGRPLDRIDEITFDHVSYSYRPGTRALSDITFTVKRGETVGIIGPSGAGKSTLVQLLLRLREPEEGAVLVNGVDAREFSLDSWYDKVTYVPQECRLLDTTIAENIRFLREIPMERIVAAARMAHIHDEIEAMPLGYDTPVGPGGGGVSGGQRQRIALARALAGHPDVVVLDEPTSSLDPKSEDLVRRSLAALKGSVTVFVVAHRMSTLTVCDKMLVLKGGSLQAFGAPEALAQESPYYREAVRLSIVRG